MTRLKMAVLLLAGMAACGGGSGGAGPWRAYTAPGTFTVTALWAFAPDDVWAGGQSMLHFDGTAFTEVTTPIPVPGLFVADFWGVAPNDLYAVGGVNLLHWDGAAWSVVDFAGALDPYDLTAVWATSGSDIWLGDSVNGYTYHWNGTAWSMGISQTVEVNDLWGVPGGPVFAGGTFGLSQWSGSAWADISDGVAGEAAGMWGFSANDVWTASDFGTLAHWDGAMWTNTLPTDNPDFNDSTTSIWGAAPDDVWAVGDFGALSHWDGARWTQTEYGKFPYLPYLNKVHGSSASDIWAVGRNSDASNTGIILHKQP